MWKERQVYSIVQEENFYEIARGGLKGYDTR
jgi:hypothetical protein